MDYCIEVNLNRVRERITAAAARSGRSADQIELVAVSKQQPAEAIAAAYAAGVRHFGENRSAELVEKAAHFAADDDIVWHFIGQLQRRQSQPVAAYADFFHAVDRLSIAQRLDRQLAEIGRTLPLFIEINISGEASKHGFDVSRWEDDGGQREAISAAAATIADFSRIEVCGLMTMAPWGAPQNEIRTVFQRTRRLAEWLRDAVPSADWDMLSMGMTNDFEIAIEEGATHVRVGRAIFAKQ